ncbi:hypothetical protein HZS_2323, partial [Henneguya salminicola]
MHVFDKYREYPKYINFFKSSLRLNMGQTLSEPMTEKKNENGLNKDIKYAVTAMQGWRKTMEDSHFCSLPFSEEFPDWNYFSIFDGHAGGTASEYCAASMLQKIKNKFKEITQKPIKIENKDEYIGLSEHLPLPIYNLSVALHDSFIEIDDDLRAEREKTNEPIKSGTTALALIVTESFIIFANCGDSRGILVRDDKVFFGTKDHKPTLPQERARIIKAGGSVFADRVNGDLAVSRALGDFSFKTNIKLSSTEQVVSPEPNVTTILRDKSDQLIVLACDGIWDVMSNDRVAELVLDRLHVTDNLVEITDCMVDSCLYNDSRDNMTSLIVCLPGAPTISSKAVDQERETENLIRAEIFKITSEDKDICFSSLLKKLSQNLPIS